MSLWRAGRRNGETAAGAYVCVRATKPRCVDGDGWSDGQRDRSTIVDRAASACDEGVKTTKGKGHEGNGHGHLTLFILGTAIKIVQEKRHCYKIQQSACFLLEPRPGAIVLFLFFYFVQELLWFDHA